MKLMSIHHHSVISLPCPALKGSSADCNGMNLAAIHLKEDKANLIQVDRLLLSLLRAEENVAG